MKRREFFRTQHSSKIKWNLRAEKLIPERKICVMNKAWRTCVCALPPDIPSPSRCVASPFPWLTTHEQQSIRDHTAENAILQSFVDTALRLLVNFCHVCLCSVAVIIAYLLSLWSCYAEFCRSTPDAFLPFTFLSTLSLLCCRQCQ